MGLLKYNKVYVMAPYHFASGGPELAHQLVDYLRKKNKESFIVYDHNGVIESNDLSITKEYRKYNVKVSPRIEEKDDNVIVIPETCQQYISKFQHIRICIWWMSVDNAVLFNNNFIDTIRFNRGLLNKLRILKHFYLYKNKYSFKKIKSEDYRLTHFYQSTYIQQFLYKLGLSRIIRLTDYINPDILSNVDTSKKKENIILFNPIKGFEYTSRLINLMPQYHFIALKGYTREQLNELFDKAKLYIDFGNFPGKDRLPREAAIHNCCIITGKFGASKYYEDVPIDSKYKFDMLHANYKEIKACIDDILEHYDDRKNDFEYLRENIKREQENFYREIDNIFI